jgi:DNA invertase Pin-like site-specific DNA recombinase
MAAGQRVGYIRVSSVDQNTSRQLAGVDLERVFEDRASGKDTNRPALRECLAYLRDGDTLVCHSPDRLARNVEDLLRLVRELNARGVSIEFASGGLSFPANGSNPASRLMLTVLGAVAEMERALLRERQREGIELAKAKGVYKGRKRALSELQAAELRKLAGAGGVAKAELARRYGISRETLYAYLRG